MIHEIYIVDNKDELTTNMKERFKKEKEFRIKRIKTLEVEEMLNQIPSLIIINENSIDVNILELTMQIRKNEDNSITPIIVVSENKDIKHKIDILKTNVEYYVQIEEEECIYLVIKNIIRLLYTNRRVSPLTGLPGNVQIQTEMKKRLFSKKPFTLLYFDLDNFKAYNDMYGFIKGDEIIKFTARTIQKNIINNITCENSFIGHVGGDDFVAMISGDEDYERICQNIISEFDSEIKKYFNDYDIERGYLEVPNRKDVIEQYPITSISIGVVEVDSKRFKNILEIGEVGAQVKHLAKTTMGSCYKVDKRRN